MPTSNPSVPPTEFPSLIPSSYPTMMPTSRPTRVEPTTSPYAMPSIAPHILPSDVPSMTPTEVLVVITRYYRFTGVADFCNVTYEEVNTQENILLNFLNDNPTLSGTESFWVVNVTIVNDKFDYVPYTDNPAKCESTDIGESVIKAFYIPERPSESPSLSSKPSVSDAPTVVQSFAPSNGVSTFPSVYPSSNPVESPSYAPTAIPSVMPSNEPSEMPSNKPIIISGVGLCC